MKYEGRKAIVCLVGENLREVPGIAAHVFGPIDRHENPYDLAGGFGMNLTFVVDEEQVPGIVQRLHKTFFAAPDPEIFA